MRFTNKQKKALKIVEYFIPSNVEDWDSKVCRCTGYTTVGVKSDAKSDPMGISPEEAFFLRSERGIITDKVKDIPRFVSLLWGQRRMALQIKEWTKGFEDCIFHPPDFYDEQDYIQEIVKECCESAGREYKNEYWENIYKDYYKK